MATIDPMGMAASDYISGNDYEDIIVQSNILDKETLPPEYLFRTFADMPNLEQRAIRLCKGNVLDVGCGVGSHSLALQQRDISVKAIDISPQLCSVARQRGVSDCEVADIFEFQDGSYDTILMMMNGIGLSGTKERAKDLLNHLKGLLRSGGSIIFDSSDLVYLYLNEDGSVDIDIASSSYYGEINYQLHYKGQSGEPFSWLFIDKGNMADIAAECGLKVEMLIDGDHYDYLCRLVAI